VLCECITGICLLAIGGHLAVVYDGAAYIFLLAYLGLISTCRFVIKNDASVKSVSNAVSRPFSLGRFSQGPFSLLLVGLQVCNYVDIIRW